jgi:hypothetical protein
VSEHRSTARTRVRLASGHKAVWFDGSALGEEALRIRSKSLDARETSINGRDAALDERDRVLSSRPLSLDDHEQATGKHESVFEERERALAARESEIEAKQRDLEEQAARVAEREAVLDARSRALEARLAELSHRDQPPGHPDDATNRDFLAAYMERLLARSRRPKSDGDVCRLPSSKLVGSDQPAAALADARNPSNVPETESQSSPTLPASLPEPSHRQDKDSVRAELDSLRHIANTAARSAIATHASKASREKMRSFTLSLVLAEVLLTSAAWGSTDCSRMGWLALAASGALAVELIVNSVRFRRRRFDRASPRGACGEF